MILSPASTGTPHGLLLPGIIAHGPHHFGMASSDIVNSDIASPNIVKLEISFNWQSQILACHLFTPGLHHDDLTV